MVMCSLAVGSDDGSTPAPSDPSSSTQKRRFFSGVVPVFVVLVLVAGAIVTLNRNENLSSMLQLKPRSQVVPNHEPAAPASPTSDLGEHGDICENQCRPSGSEALPRGIVQDKSNFEMKPLLGGDPEEPKRENASGRPAAKSLLAIAVGLKQKAVVDKLVSKFLAANFTVMLFHYDGVVDLWGDLEWTTRVVHVAAAYQTKWWFAKRFLHPDLVAEYEYVFLWDEDIEVDNFGPTRYLEIVKMEGLEISQPALDRRSKIHHRLTIRGRQGGAAVHRHSIGKGQCYGPPCTGWVEMMVPVFTRVAWRCAWHMIQNDLIYAWGLDFKLGYCAQGDRRMNVGIVDDEYVLHRGIPTLGDDDDAMAPSSPMDGSSSTTDRQALRQQSNKEMEIFNRRWKKAVANDQCWTDPYPQPVATKG